METRANYILIGAFTIAGIIGILVFFFAFARREFDTALAYYDARFSSVAGLSEASDVRFAGLPVGQVVDVRLAPERDGTVLVRVEVEAATPVRSDSIATIESQGVTGVSFVSIGPGTPDGELLEPQPGEIPEIESGRSVIQSLSEDAPALLTETLGVIRDLSEVFSDENRSRIENIIVNVEDASADFSATLESFSNVAGTVDQFVAEIERFNAIIQTIAADFDTLLISADETITLWGDVAGDVTGFLDTGTTTLETATDTLGRAGTYIDEDLAATTVELRAALGQLQEDVAALSAQGQTMLSTFTETGSLANQRLAEVEETLTGLDALIAETNATMAAVEEAATGFGTLVAGDGTALISETREMIANADATVTAIRQAAEVDLPGILAEVDRAAETIASVSATIGNDLTAASGRIEELSGGALAALEDARETFATANETLEAVTSAMTMGEDTLAAATRAFDSADRVMGEEIGGLVTRLRETLDGLDAAVAQVSEDLPGISANLSEASRAAEDAFAGISAAVNASGPAIQTFAAEGLPQYTDLAREARNLARSLDALVSRIERDPARFFLNNNAPEFRR
ncbi:MCE family protein [Rhodobacterales bacterium HKCCE2091]|nr:MCE family protein [Rhodobacterales bacterium HKCCE2091]